MAPRQDHESGARGPIELANEAEHGIGRSVFLRRAAQRSGFFFGYLFGAFVVGLGYRFLLDQPEDSSLANYLRS